MLIKSLKNYVKDSKVLYSLYSRFAWKIHMLKDWWGVTVAKKGIEADSPMGFNLTTGYHPAYRLMRNGVFEPDETALMQKIFTQVDTFVDVGANIGYYTCLALQSNTPVIAFEPQPLNLR